MPAPPLAAGSLPPSSRSRCFMMCLTRLLPPSISAPRRCSSIMVSRYRGTSPLQNRHRLHMARGTGESSKPARSAWRHAGARLVPGRALLFGQFALFFVASEVRCAPTSNPRLVVCVVCGCACARSVHSVCQPAPAVPNVPPPSVPPPSGPPPSVPPPPIVYSVRPRSLMSLIVWRSDCTASDRTSSDCGPENRVPQTGPHTIDFVIWSYIEFQFEV